MDTVSTHTQNRMGLSEDLTKVIKISHSAEIEKSNLKIEKHRSKTKGSGGFSGDTKTTFVVVFLLLLLVGVSKLSIHIEYNDSSITNYSSQPVAQPTFQNTYPRQTNSSYLAGGRQSLPNTHDAVDFVYP